MPAAQRRWRIGVDPLLLLGVLGLVLCSVISIKGATAELVDGDPGYYFVRQLSYGVVGLVLMFVIARLDYSRLRDFTLPIYVGMIGLILLVIPFGTTIRGSKRWIDVGFMNFQPSELGKVLVIVALAGFVVDRVRTWDARTTASLLAIGLVPMLLVLRQPDLGSSLPYLVGIAAVLFVAGVPWRHFAALGAMAAATVFAVLVALPAIGVQVLHGYQWDRLTSFVNPSAMSSEEAWQQEQSKIAIGAGEKTGRGFEGATQTGNDFVPEDHTDFIFAVIGEAYGFAGAALVLSLYALVIWRGLHILTISKNLYGALIAGGISLMMLFQVFVNIGMTIGIAPITGIPAPFLSYGGSSMLVSFLAVGLLQSIHAQAREIDARKGRAALFIE